MQLNKNVGEATPHDIWTEDIVSTDAEVHSAVPAECHPHDRETVDTVNRE